MRSNILSIAVYKDQALQVILSSLVGVLKAREDICNVQVEIKYSKFVYFYPPPNLHQLISKADKQTQNRFRIMGGYMMDQNSMHLETLKKLSHQQIIYLNPLTKRVYRIISEFSDTKKFYHIRDFFKKLCHYNQEKSRKGDDLIQNGHQISSDAPKNIYQQISGIGQNSRFQMLQLNQIRFDIYVKNEQDLSGRYSYTFRDGWKKTIKTSLIRQQIDIMVAQQPFRVAMNQQKEDEVQEQTLMKIANIMKVKPQHIELRLKKTMKVLHNNRIEMSLSQVYETKEFSQDLPEIKDIICQKCAIIEEYIIKKMQYFYKAENKEKTKLEVESEFTKQGLNTLKDKIASNKFKDIEIQFELALQDLYSLFYVDHRTKILEAVWLQALSQCKNSKLINARLENQYGSYMRNFLYEKMQNKQSQDNADQLEKK